MGMFLLLFGLAAHQAESILVKQHGKKHGSGGMFFNAIICMSATIYYFITDKGGLQFTGGILVYGVVNWIMYAVGFYAAYLALQYGSFGMTRLLSSFGGIITIFYGIVFLKEPTSVYMYIAVVLVFVSVFLMNYQKSDKTLKKKTNVKWLIFVLLTILSNAAIAIIGRMQFGEFGDTYKNEYLIISTGGAAIILFVIGMFLEGKNFIYTFRYGLLYGVSAGVFNGINGAIGLVLYNYFTVSFLSPVKTALSIIISFLVSALIYKEKFSIQQKISVVIGIVAVVIMNLKF